MKRFLNVLSNLQHRNISERPEPPLVFHWASISEKGFLPFTRRNWQNRFIVFRFLVLRLGLCCCLSTLSKGWKVILLLQTQNVKCETFFRQSPRSGVSILSSPWEKTEKNLSVHPGTTSSSHRLQRESSLRAGKRDQSFSHYFHPFSAASPFVGWLSSPPF